MSGLPGRSVPKHHCLGKDNMGETTPKVMLTFIHNLHAFVSILLPPAQRSMYIHFVSTPVYKIAVSEIGGILSYHIAVELMPQPENVVIPMAYGGTGLGKHSSAGG